MEQKSKLTKPMTRPGYIRLADEFNNLRNVERPRVVEKIATAAAEGDRSENAEYIYGKKRLRELDKRLRYLSELLKDVQIIDLPSGSLFVVSFGATVEILENYTSRKRYTIVGVGESDAQKGTVSWQSPMGKALFGKKVGDTVTVRRPIGDLEVEIVAIGGLDTVS